MRPSGKYWKPPRGKKSGAIEVQQRPVHRQTLKYGQAQIIMTILAWYWQAGESYKLAQAATYDTLSLWVVHNGARDLHMLGKWRYVAFADVVIGGLT